MRTAVAWPQTYREMSGMDRFCGGPSCEDISAADFLRSARPIVNRVIHNLEQEINHLRFEVERLNKLVSGKPRVKYRKDIDCWVLVRSEG